MRTSHAREKPLHEEIFTQHVEARAQRAQPPRPAAGQRGAGYKDRASVVTGLRVGSQMGFRSPRNALTHACTAATLLASA